MTPDEAFLQAIRECPADDTPRLIYSDWLEERGDAASRAQSEFIRVQFALCGLPPEDPLRPQLEERERELRLANETAWLSPLHQRCRFERCEFRRGFVEKVALSLEQFASDAPALFALVPIQEVEITATYGSLDSDVFSKVVASPLLGQLTALDLSKAYLGTGHNLVPLLFSPHLSALQCLSLPIPFLDAPQATFLEVPFLSHLTTLRLRDYPGEGSNGLTALLRSDRLSNLKTLDFCGAAWSNNQRGTSLTRRIVEATSLPALSELDLRSNALSASSVRALVNSDLPLRLERLHLGRNPLGDPGITALVKSRRLGRLQMLDLSASQIGSAGVSALAKCTDLERLGALHLRANRLGDAGLRKLCGAARLSNLTVLHLASNRLGAAGVRSLAQTPPGRLAVLDLSWNPLTDDAARTLATAPALESLAALDLSYCQLGDESARALAESSSLNNLHTLNLSTNRLTDAGVEALARSSALPGLTALNLGYNAISAAGVRTLAESPRFTRLTALNLAGNRIDPVRLNELRREFRGTLGG